MQIGVQDIKNLLVTMFLRKKTFWKIKIKKDTFSFFFAWELVKQILLIWNCHSKDQAQIVFQGVRRID
jgi:hypothetical protein